MNNDNILKCSEVAKMNCNKKKRPRNHPTMHAIVLCVHMPFKIKLFMKSLQAEWSENRLSQCKTITRP